MRAFAESSDERRLRRTFIDRMRRKKVGLAEKKIIGRTTFIEFSNLYQTHGNDNDRLYTEQGSTHTDW